MRAQTLVVLPFVIVGVLAAPRAWPWFSAIGMSGVALNNLLVLRRQREVTKARPKISTAGRAGGYWRGTETSVTLAEWVPTLFVYSTLVGGLALALTVGWGGDYGVYAVISTVINLVFFGYLEAMRKGKRIGPSLVRTMVLAERWDQTTPPAHR